MPMEDQNNVAMTEKSDRIVWHKPQLTEACIEDVTGSNGSTGAPDGIFKMS